MMKSELVQPETETTYCDLCHAEESQEIYCFQDILYELPGEFTMRQCASCGLMYLSPRPTPTAIGLYYPPQYSSYHKPIEEEKTAVMQWIRRRKLTKRRQLITQFSAKQTGDILDVGSSTGLFLNEMQRSGWRVQGIEPIAVAAEFAQTHYGIQVFQGMFNQASFAPESFDAITFWDVLEHTYSPTEELNLAANLLRPGGIIAISVPNWDSVERQWFGKHWQGYDPPRHLYVFNRATLTTLLEQSGFEVLAWVCFMPSYFSFIISLQRWLKTKNPTISRWVMKIATFPGMRLPFEPWFSYLNHRGKGSVISVFAQKK